MKIIDENNCQCEYCNKRFSKSEITNPRSACMRHEIYCSKKKEILEKFGGKEGLDNLLSEYGSILGLQRYFKEIEFTIGDGALRKIFKELEIDTSIKRSNNSEAVKNKRKQTNLELYGVEHNFCKEHPSRKKWEAELLEKEGITNVFQRESVKQKSIQTMLNKYGVEHAVQSDKFKVTKEYCIKKYGETDGLKIWKEICYNKGKSMRYAWFEENYGERAAEEWEKRIANMNSMHNGSSISSLNKKVLQLLKQSNVEFEQEFCLWLTEYVPRFYDFRIGKILIELNGDFWHASPRKYKNGDVLNFPGGSKTVESIWEHDRIKKELAEKNGYTVICYWESDINSKDKWETIKEEIINYAISQNKINQ